MNQSPPGFQLTEESMNEEYQKRYFLSHTNRMIELCYPVVVPRD